MTKLFANSREPDQMPHSAASDLGLHCFANSSRKTCLYNFDPLKPQFYIVKLGFRGVYIIFLICAQKHRLWVFARIALVGRF